MQFEGRKRVSADDAMRHPFFQSLGERVTKLPDSEWGQGLGQGLWLGLGGYSLGQQVGSGLGGRQDVGLGVRLMGVERPGARA